MKKAKLYWISETNGGRKKLPDTKVYYPTTIFCNDENMWSLVIEFDESPFLLNNMVSECKVRFLVDHAPKHLLDTAREIPIYEGPNKVGQIKFYD